MFEIILPDGVRFIFSDLSGPKADWSRRVKAHDSALLRTSSNLVLHHHDRPLARELVHRPLLLMVTGRLITTGVAARTGRGRTTFVFSPFRRLNIMLRREILGVLGATGIVAVSGSKAPRQARGPPRRRPRRLPEGVRGVRTLLQQNVPVLLLTSCRREKRVCSGPASGRRLRQVLRSVGRPDREPEPTYGPLLPGVRRGVHGLCTRVRQVRFGRDEIVRQGQPRVRGNVPGDGQGHGACRPRLIDRISGGPLTA